LLKSPSAFPVFKSNFLTSGAARKTLGEGENDVTFINDVILPVAWRQYPAPEEKNLRPTNKNVV